MMGNYNGNEFSTDERANELETESAMMNKIFRNLKDEFRQELLEKAMEYYEDKHNRRNPYK